MNPHLAWLVPVATLATVGCFGGDKDVGLPPDLASFVCVPGDLPGDYLQQTEGDFSRDDLAGLASNADKRRAELKAAGLLGGHVNYWKQAVAEPPFAPPLDIVCQVMAFSTEAQASKFVAGLRADAVDLATTGLAWLPTGARSVVEERSGIESLPRGSRAFRIEAEDRHLRVTLYAVVMPSKAHVQTVYIGNGNGAASLPDAVGIAKRLAERTAASAP